MRFLEQLEQITLPHLLQWCLRLNIEKMTFLQHMHSITSVLLTHWSLSGISSGMTKAVIILVKLTKTQIKWLNTSGFRV